MMLLPPRRFLAVLVFFSLAAVSGCASITREMKGPCGTGPNSGICTGPMTRIPTKRVEDFSRAGQLAIDVVHSDAFLDELRDYMRRYPAAPGDTAWKELTAEEITAALRQSLPGLPVRTRGTLKDAWDLWVQGNVGWEGDHQGPMIINRFTLRGRTAYQVVNTIVHEGAHRAGLTHPDSNDGDDDALTRAFCQPPYVVGTIAERLAKGPSWTWDYRWHCKNFAPASATS